MKNLTLCVTYTARPGMRESFIRAVEDSGIAGKIRKEKGCLGYDYFCPVENKDKVLLVEKWESEEDQKIHMQQPHMNMLSFVKDCYIKDTQLERL